MPPVAKPNIPDIEPVVTTSGEEYLIVNISTPPIDNKRSRTSDTSRCETREGKGKGATNNVGSSDTDAETRANLERATRILHQEAERESLRKQAVL